MPSYDDFLRDAPPWRRKERPGEDVAMMLKDIEKLRGRFNEAAIEQSIVWINRIDKKQWVDTRAHWGETGRLERPAAGGVVVPRTVGESKEERKDEQAPTPGVALRSQVSIAGRAHYQCLDSKLTFKPGDMCIIQPAPSLRMVSDEGNLLRFFVAKIVRTHSTGGLRIHWSIPYSASFLHTCPCLLVHLSSFAPFISTSTSYHGVIL